MKVTHLLVYKEVGEDRKMKKEIGKILESTNIKEILKSYTLNKGSSKLMVSPYSEMLWIWVQLPFNLSPLW